jgi:hypothetical protein
MPYTMEICSILEQITLLSMEFGNLHYNNDRKEVPRVCWGPYDLGVGCWTPMPKATDSRLATSNPESQSPHQNAKAMLRIIIYTLLLCS